MSEAMPMERETELPIEKMPNLRLFYRKRGRAKYISHLDITRCMQRSLKRRGCRCGTPRDSTPICT